MSGLTTSRTAVFVAMGLAAASFTACGDRVATFDLSGRSMGTTYSIQLVGSRAARPDKALRDQVATTLDRIEKRMSTYLAESEVSRFNEDRSGQWFPVSTETCRLVERAKGLSEASGGAFDITVAPLVNAWGFGPEPEPAGYPDEDALSRLESSVGFNRLETDCDAPALRKLNPALEIDLSGFAKGYAVDQVAALLDRRGYENFLVEIGGELKARGRNASERPWRIAIENPVAANAEPAGIVGLTREAMATSGDYRNFFELDGKRYSHTIDPRTGWPVAHDLTAVTVIGESAADADALATALLVLGPEEGMVLAERLGLSVRMMLRDGAGYRTRDSAAFRARANRH